MKTIYYLKYKLLLIVFLLSQVTMAQTDQFRVLDGVPHLPVVANTGSVASPETGMLVYNNASGSPMIYVGNTWINLCETAASVGGSSDFQVKGKIPYIPLQNTGTGDIVSGSIYLNSSSGSVKVYDGSSWLDVPNLNSGSFSSQSGFSSRISTVQIPVLGSDPAPTGLSVGAIYISSTAKAIKYYNGSSWQALTCNYIPVANGVNIIVNTILKEGHVITGDYNYYDVEGDPEDVASTALQWYRYDNTSGTNKVAISGATNIDYTLTSDDVGKYLRFGVTPAALSGTSPGNEAFSSYSGLIQANAIPLAQNLDIIGNLKLNSEVCGSYDYSDIEGDSNGGGNFKWYRATALDGTGESIISGATDSCYTVGADDIGKYIAFSVIPNSITGTTPGVEVKSIYEGPAYDNEPPRITNLAISGTMFPGATVFSLFTYEDDENDAEGTHEYIWEIADDASGAGASIVGTASNYQINASDANKYLRVTVIPKALTGNLTGEAVSSSWVGPISPTVQYFAVGIKINEWSGTTIKIKGYDNGTFNCKIYWDIYGSAPSEITSFDDPDLEHYYSSGSPYLQTIRIEGEIGEFEFENKSWVVRKIYSWGPGLYSYDRFLSNCQYLSEIPDAPLPYNPNITSFNNTFSDCRSLYNIPENIFANNPQVTSFANTFARSVITDIPAGIFANNKKIEKFDNTFYGCGNITSIPEDLFANNPEVTEFKNLFSYCDNLNAIPENLFANNKKVTSMISLFSNCDKITLIPENLFANNAQLALVDYTFTGTGITLIPENLFANNPLLTSNYSTFSSTDITAIPENLYANNPLLSQMSGTFTSCQNLTSIPENLFASNPNLSEMLSVFSNTGITSIPENIFANNTLITNMSQVFLGTKITSIPENLFINNTSVTNMNGAFQNCELLTSIPANLFSNNPNINDFSNCFRYWQINTTLSGVAPNLWLTHPTANGIECFYNRTGLSNYGSIPGGWK